MRGSKGGLGSDLARLDATTDEEITRQIAEDPDTAPELTDEQLDAAEMFEGDRFVRRVGRPKGSGRKELVTLRLDRDVLARFRAEGPGWQTRLNNALRPEAAAKMRRSTGESAREAARRKVYAEGYAAAMREVRSLASKPPSPSGAAASGTGRGRREKTRVARPLRARVSGARPQRGNNARMIEEILQGIAPRSARPTDIRQALQREKGIEMAFTSIRHALGQLAKRQVVEQLDASHWAVAEPAGARERRGR